MRRFIRLFAVVLLVVLVFSLTVFSDSNYPSPTSTFFVNDFAGVIGSNIEEKIAVMGKQLETETGAQIVLVTIDSLEGQDIDTYSIELATKWGIGQKGEDNGVLIMNSVGDREVRIEVGYGLNDVLGAIRTNEIIDDIMAPHLAEGNYDSGLLNGYTAVLDRVADKYGVSIEHDPVQQQVPRQSARRSGSNAGNAMLFFIGVIAIVLDGIFLRFRITSTIIKIIFWSGFFRGGGRGGRGGRGGFGGGGFGGGGFGGGSSGGGGSFGGGGSSGKY